MNPITTAMERLRSNRYTPDSCGYEARQADLDTIEQGLGRQPVAPQPPAEAQSAEAVAWRSQGKSGWTFTDMPHARDIATGIWEPLYIDPPPSAPVGVEGLVSRAISQGKRLQWSAVMDTLERLRGTLALAQQPAAVGGPYRLVDDVVTVNGIALDEVVRLGDRYAATIEKRGMPRAAQVFEALVLIGKHALAAQQGGATDA